MLINVIPYDKDKSDPIINSIPLGVAKGQFYEVWYMRKYHMVKHYGLNSKQIFKKVFGKQLTCWNIAGWYRNWIWTFSSEAKDATVYCIINKRGTHWEMNTDSNLPEIIKLREEIERRLIA